MLPLLKEHGGPSVGAYIKTAGGSFYSDKSLTKSRACIASAAIGCSDETAIKVMELNVAPT